MRLIVGDRSFFGRETIHVIATIYNFLMSLRLTLAFYKCLGLKLLCASASGDTHVLWEMTYVHVWTFRVRWCMCFLSTYRFVVYVWLCIYFVWKCNTRKCVRNACVWFKKKTAWMNASLYVCRTTDTGKMFLFRNRRYDCSELVAEMCSAVGVLYVLPRSNNTV